MGHFSDGREAWGRGQTARDGQTLEVKMDDQCLGLSQEIWTEWMSTRRLITRG